LKKYTKKYTDAFLSDLKTLNISEADIFPRATDHINEMVAMIQKLSDKGLAYKGEDGSWYYSVSKFKNYGKLSRLKFEGLKEGARVKQDDYDKDQAQDFALWKGYSKEDGDVFWETSLGKGRPGWHIECSAMNTKYLGNGFDIHTGGIDLVFPHHENEIAQAEGCTESPYVNYWVHNEHLLVDGKKMSKSLGNFYTLRDLLDKGYSAVAIRYLLLSTHYRQQANFTFKALEGAKGAVDKLNNFIFVLGGMDCDEDVGNIDELIKETRAAFEMKMDDDLNISGGLAVIFDFMSDVNKLRLSKDDASKVISFMKEVDAILGVMDFKKNDENIPKDIESLIKSREDARKNKDFDKADKIRDDLKEKGIELIDTPEGVRWKKV